MKITDLRLDGFNNIAKRDEQGNVELFYVIEMNTIRVKYVEATGEVLELIVNGRKVQPENKEIIDQLNLALSQAKKDKLVNSISVKITDLHLEGFNSIKKVEPNGSVELFFMIGMNTLRVSYNETTSLIESLEINGDKVDFRDSEVLASLNANLDAARGTYTKRHEEPSFVRLGDLHLDDFSALEKAPDSNGIAELFYMIGMNTVRVRYDTNDERVISLEVNGDKLDLNNQQVIQDFNSALDEVRRKQSGIVY